MNTFYGAYIKTSVNKFNPKKFDAMFKVIKNKGYTKTFSFPDSEESFTSLKVHLFCGLNLEKNKLYLISITETGEYMGNTYPSKIAAIEVPESKAANLMKKYLTLHPNQEPVRTLSTQVLEFSDTEEDDVEEDEGEESDTVPEVVPPTPVVTKTKKRKTKKTKKTKKKLVEFSDSD